MIVSNNTAEAITTYLNRFTATSLIRGVVGREPRRPDLLKPHPSLVLAALALIPVVTDQAVLIGDSVTDIEVAHSTGVRAIGVAKNQLRFAQMEAAGASSVIKSMIELQAET